jgi:hypothetical protein
MAKYTIKKDIDLAFSAYLKDGSPVIINRVLSYTEDKEKGILEIEAQEGTHTFQTSDLLTPYRFTY